MTDEAPPAESTEQEPNNLPAAASAISGELRLQRVSLPRSRTKASRTSICFASMRRRASSWCSKSTRPGKSRRSIRKLEVLDAAGKPIPRVVLQAVRSSYFTFRGHDSTDVNDFRLHGAQDMELNEYVYANGEVMKLWLLPRGPDSGFLGVSGRRRQSLHLFWLDARSRTR